MIITKPTELKEQLTVERFITMTKPDGDINTMTLLIKHLPANLKDLCVLAALTNIHHRGSSNHAGSKENEEEKKT
ncbi:unnamed protein product [Hydatigera taeniaeformis]|uniref:PseudoU_synth_2 domain-containing protein n=1 Tax=Hydatigena taeniaeformis TaxID=6205 RepID=A0A0R3X6Y1_HYDTA|nr:unnamed protein product [Hydatigera taeniaeformis]